MIITERLFIRPFRFADAPFILELVNTEDWLKFIGDRGVKTLTDAEDFIKTGPFESYQANGYGAWLVQDKASKEPLGLCGFFKRDYLDWPDIGFAFLPEVYGQGYGTESAKACLDYGITQYQWPNIYAITSPKNSASIKLLEKIGLKCQKQFALEAEILALFALKPED